MSSQHGESGQAAGKAAEDRQFEEELERRLETIEAPGYEDPAGKDLPTIDLVIFLVVSAVVIVLVHLWGY